MLTGLAEKYCQNRGDITVLNMNIAYLLPLMFELKSKGKKSKCYFEI